MRRKFWEYAVLEFLNMWGKMQKFSIYVPKFPICALCYFTSHNFGKTKLTSKKVTGADPL